MKSHTVQLVDQQEIRDWYEQNFVSAIEPGKEEAELKKLMDASIRDREILSRELKRLPKPRAQNTRKLWEGLTNMLLNLQGAEVTALADMWRDSRRGKRRAETILKDSRK